MKLEKEDGLVFDYEAKYVSDNIIKETFPEIEDDVSEELKKQSLLVYNYFDVKGMARVEFIVKN
jgi:D-alanine-D-alanine ligase-like ATP-grasp enzyme